jgi:hypothetical protein
MIFKVHLDIYAMLLSISSIMAWNKIITCIITHWRIFWHIDVSVSHISAYPLKYLCYSRTHGPYVKKYNRVQNIIDLYYFDSKRRSSYYMFLNEKSAASTQSLVYTSLSIHFNVKCWKCWQVQMMPLVVNSLYLLCFKNHSYRKR